MRVLICITLMISLLSCSSEDELNGEGGGGLISTESSGDQNQKNELEAFLEGEWTQTENCENNGHCNTIPSSTWVFKAGEVEWNEFTHPYLIRNDTVYIAGTPYRVISELSDTIHFRAEGTQLYMKLIRK